MLAFTSVMTASPSFHPTLPVPVTAGSGMLTVDEPLVNVAASVVAVVLCPSS